MSKQIALFLSLLLFSLVLFQNCGDTVDFDSNKNALSESGVSSTSDNNDSVKDSTESTDDKNVVCNPLDPKDDCSTSNPGSGLLGKLYYLTNDQHASLFNNDLQRAKLKDYREKGIQVPVDIIMTQFNISPRSWTSGFKIPNQGQVKTDAGEDLFEWFHLDMNGFLELPAGDYQIASLSDDGIRITLNGVVVIERDNVHGPTWDCSIQKINFKENEKKLIRLEYHQGPRTQIALQVFARPYKAGTSCSNHSGLTVIGPESYSHMDKLTY